MRAECGARSVTLYLFTGGGVPLLQQGCSRVVLANAYGLWSWTCKMCTVSCKAKMQGKDGSEIREEGR